MPGRRETVGRATPVVWIVGDVRMPDKRSRNDTSDLGGIYAQAKFASTPRTEPERKPAAIVPAKPTQPAVAAVTLPVFTARLGRIEIQQQPIGMLEDIVRHGLIAWRQMAAAVGQLQVLKAHQIAGLSWDAYCRERFGFSRNRASQLLSAGEWADEQEAKGLPPPATEAEARRQRPAGPQKRKYVTGVTSGPQKRKYVTGVTSEPEPDNDVVEPVERRRDSSPEVFSVPRRGPEMQTCPTCGGTGEVPVGQPLIEMLDELQADD